MFIAVGKEVFTAGGAGEVLSEAAQRLDRPVGQPGKEEAKRGRPSLVGHSAGRRSRPAGPSTHFSVELNLIFLIRVSITCEFFF